MYIIILKQKNTKCQIYDILRMFKFKKNHLNFILFYSSNSDQHNYISLLF
jgi:hypothetical protein